MTIAILLWKRWSKNKTYVGDYSTDFIYVYWRNSCSYVFSDDYANVSNDEFYIGGIYMQNEEGFTLLEMLLVMVVITVLLLLIIPNVVTQRSSVEGKGCKAYVKSIEAQVQVYQLQHNKIPTLKELSDEKYITADKCPNGESIHISNDGTVTSGKL